MAGRLGNDILSLAAPHLGEPIGSFVSGKKGLQAKYRCPFHKSGMERRPAFYLNIETGWSFCHTCKEGWSLPRLLANLGASSAEITTAEAVMGDSGRVIVEPVPDEEVPLPEALLGVFHQCPLDLVDEGFDKDLLRAYNIGVDHHNDRITYPIRDHVGALMGIVGGSKHRQPKYLVYGPGQLSYFLPDYPLPRYAIENRNYLWNLDRVWPWAYGGDYDGPIIVVEGYKAALWVIQCGYPMTVALMGSYLSKRQANFLLHLNNRLVVFLDYDEAGWDGSPRAVRTLRAGGGSAVGVPWQDLGKEPDLQPDDLEPAEVRTLIESVR